MEMNSEKQTAPYDSSAGSQKQLGKEAAVEEWVPLGVRNARKIRHTLWPHLWMSFVSITLLAAALAIVAYRMGAQSCR
jgi:hypothetical protein